MFRVSSSVEYAVRIMLRLGTQPQGGTLSAERVSASEDIPRDFVDQLLMRLRRDGLVISQRGARGGYRLAQAPKKTFLGSIIRAVEGRTFLSTCDRFVEKGYPCRRRRSCGIRPVWKRLGVMVDGFLDEVSLLELSPEKWASVRVSAASSKTSRRTRAAKG